MDRDEALKLLNGGEDGVKAWNRQRADGEKIPNLLGTNLSGRADLPAESQSKIHSEPVFMCRLSFLTGRQ